MEAPIIEQRRQPMCVHKFRQPMYVHNFNVHDRPDFDALEQRVDDLQRLVKKDMADICPGGFALHILKQITPEVIKEHVVLSYYAAEKHKPEHISLSFNYLDPSIMFSSTGFDLAAGEYPCTSVVLNRDDFRNPFRISRRREQYLQVVDRDSGESHHDVHYCMPYVTLTREPGPTGWEVVADPEWFERGSILIQKAAAKFDLATAWLPAYEIFMEAYREAQAEAERKAAEKPKGLFARLFRR